MQNNTSLKQLFSFVVLSLGLVTLFSSCKKEYETIEQIDQRSLAAYKAAHPNAHFTDTAGYSYEILAPGAGAKIQNSDSIFYAYTFKNFEGKVLTQTDSLMIPGTFLGYSDQFIIGNVGYVLTPIREVFSKLKRGGKAQLLLPSQMAFGKNGLSSFGIGANESLLVEIGIYTFQKKHEVDNFEINTYITKNNLVLDTDLATGIRYKVLAAGSGADDINDFSTLEVTYTGRNLDGRTFDSGKGISFRLDQLIKGWQRILPGRIKAGGKIRVIIPSHLAYGTAPLDFDIEVTKITNN